MLGILFFILCFCAWVGKILANKERYYDNYKAKGTDKYGCWKDGHNNWHYGNKLLDTFYIGGHEVLAVPDLLSGKDYMFTRYHYVVRDLTLENQFQREKDEIFAFHADMKARKKAIEEGKNFYEIGKNVRLNSMMENGAMPERLHDIYRRVDNNRMYFIYQQQIYKKPYGYKYIMYYLKDGYVNRKKLNAFDNDWNRTLVRAGSEELEVEKGKDTRDTWGFADNMISNYYLHD